MSENLVRLFFFFFLNNCIVPFGISTMGNSGCFEREKPAATQSRYSAYGACWEFQCFHNPPNSDMDDSLFNVRTDVNAYDAQGGCKNTVRESALKVDSGKKNPLPHRGNRTCIRGVPVRRSTNRTTCPPHFCIRSSPSREGE